MMCATTPGGSSAPMTSSAMDYMELHCHSFYSLLDGTSSPADLVSRAADLGMDALALTDHDAVYGAVPFVRAAKARGIHPILGAELTLETGHHLTRHCRRARRRRHEQTTIGGPCIHHWD